MADDHKVYSLENGGADGDCCICCGTYIGTMTSAPLYTNPAYFYSSFGSQPMFVNGENPNPVNPNPVHIHNEHFATCYCHCCACYPQGNLDFRIIQGTVSKRYGGETTDICNKVGANGLYYYEEDMDNKDGWSFKLTRSDTECKAVHENLNTLPEAEWKQLCGSSAGPKGNFKGAPYTESNPQQDNPPEAWGYRGKICEAAITTTDLPGYSSPGACQGQGIVAALCCCKGTTTNYWGSMVGGQQEPVDFGVDHPCPPQPISFTYEEDEVAAYQSCPYGARSIFTLFPDVLDLDTPTDDGPSVQRHQECMMPCFNFTLMADPIYEKTIQTVEYQDENSVASVTITNKGSYGSPPSCDPLPTCTFSPPDGWFGVGQAEGVPILDNNCEVVGVTITNPGFGYTSAPTITFSQSSEGAGAPTAAGDVVLTPCSLRLVDKVHKTACSPCVHNVGQCNRTSHPNLSEKVMEFEPDKFYGGQFIGGTISERFTANNGLQELFDGTTTALGTMSILSGQCQSKNDDPEKKFAIAFLGAYVLDCDCQTGLACMRYAEEPSYEDYCAGDGSSHAGCGCGNNGPGNPEEPCEMWMDNPSSVNFNDPDWKGECWRTPGVEMGSQCRPCFVKDGLLRLKRLTPNCQLAKYGNEEGAGAHPYGWSYAQLGWPEELYWPDWYWDQCNGVQCFSSDAWGNPTSTSCEGCQSEEAWAQDCGQVRCRYSDSDDKCHYPCRSRLPSIVWFTGIIEEE